MTKLHELARLGQSIWLDYIRRAFIESGELEELIAAGVTGLTSNPAIFEKAIAGSADYDLALQAASAEGKSIEEIYESLVIEDIQRTADLLHPVYKATDGLDGYVSLEVNPNLADDAQGTISEALRLHRLLDRPNTMIKVPATPEGLKAVESLIGQGISVNVTLIFAYKHYIDTAEAYLRGLEKLAEDGGDLSKVASVASFFLSRIDTAVDQEFSKINEPWALEKQGKIAIASAQLAYRRFLEIYSGPRWDALAAKGAQPQRLLWASTGAKNPNYPDTMYVDNLIGRNTVNTLPPATLNAFLDHGTVAETLTYTTSLQGTLEQVFLEKRMFDLDGITDRLQVEGVEKFIQPFDSLMNTISGKVARMRGDQTLMEAQLGPYQAAVDDALLQIKEQEIIRRIWAHDHSVWSDSPEEITNRLGWLHAPEMMSDNLAPIFALKESVESDGYTDVLLLGMGGSSLAPEVFSNLFGPDNHGLNLSVLDSTDPAAVKAAARQIDPAQTLFIVATKSGGTVETLSFFKYFYNLTVKAIGADAAGAHFVAITDGGSRLHQLAADYDFRAAFLNDPNIGGRYSALSHFGLAPAALVGLDLHRLLDRALIMVRNIESCNCPVDGDNQAGRLGAIVAELAKAGRDKLTLITSPALGNFGDWVEQLIAESTGKDGKGILPVVGESLDSPAVYGDDRLFVHLRLPGDKAFDPALNALLEAGHPLVTIHLDDPYDLGGQFILWEMATAIAGHLLNINPFDQPNVETAKNLAREMVQTYQAEGVLPSAEASPLDPAALYNFLAQGNPGDYLTIQAYVQPTAEITETLQSLRLALREKTRLATTLGYGPRFLHSTGQLHKGDSGNGLFIQFVSNNKDDVPIPDEASAPGSSISFGVLKFAQALGDAQALLEAKRRVIRFQIDGDPAAALSRLIE